MIVEVLAWFLVVSLLTMVILLVTWGRKVSRLMRYLEDNCPNDFDALGRPHLIGNNTPRHTVKFVKFIHMRSHKDPHVESARATLLVMFWVYLASFGYVMGYILVSAATS